jgi:hypothetical protein
MPRLGIVSGQRTGQCPDLLTGGVRRDRRHLRIAQDVQRGPTAANARSQAGPIASLLSTARPSTPMAAATLAWEHRELTATARPSGYPHVAQFPGDLVEVVGLEHAHDQSAMGTRCHELSHCETAGLR